jgi:hypothetical protein
MLFTQRDLGLGLCILPTRMTDGIIDGAQFSLKFSLQNDMKALEFVT